MLARLHPHHPDTGGGVQIEVDRACRLDTLGRHGTARVRVGVVPGFVGAGLADDPPFVDGEEAGQRLVERRMGLERLLGLGQRGCRTGQVEEIPGDDQDPWAVPGVQGPRHLGGDGRSRGGGLRGQEQVADHHDPPAQGNLDTGDARFGREGASLGARFSTVEAYHLQRLCIRSHGPSIVEASRR